MSIYLGDSGSVELTRSSTSTSLVSELSPGDVNVSKRRFSCDFDISALITGDQIDLVSVDKTDLEFIANHPYNTWRGYVNIDDMGGVRLFDTFDASLNNEISQAVELAVPSVTQRIGIRTRSSVNRCLAKVTSYEITTSRETVDITALGEEHRRNYANGLISGQGTLNCFWAYEASCEDNLNGPVEFPHYLAQLVLRTQQGASFIGRFYVNRDNPERLLWYEAQCVVTNAAMSFAAGAPVTTQIQFVTTGPVRLNIGIPSSYLLLENLDKLLQEDGSGILLEDR